MPNPKTMPPLTWLRAFCEAGRQSSFKQAAATLNLSPSTVSHEIRKLEDWVQTPLFIRAHAKIALTDEGGRLFAAVGPAFDQLEQAFEQFAEKSSTSIRIGMLPYYASEFVVPMIDRLSEHAADGAISITSNIHLAALEHADPNQRVDAVVRYASRAPAGCSCVALTEVSLALVTGNRATSDDQIPVTRRVQLDDAFDGWQVLESAGVALPPTHEPPIVVDNYLSAMRAVAQGSAIGIAILPLCEPWLRDGRIRLLDQQIVQIPQRYCLVWRKNSTKANRLELIAEQMAEEFSQRSQQS